MILLHGECLFRYYPAPMSVIAGETSHPPKRHQFRWWYLLPVLIVGGSVFSFWYGTRTVEIDAEALLGRPVEFDRDVMPIIQQRCIACHAEKPTYQIPLPPKGVILENEAQVKYFAARIHKQAVELKAMPAGNLTHITEYERAVIGAWYKRVKDPDSPKVRKSP